VSRWGWEKKNRGTRRKEDREEESEERGGEEGQQRQQRRRRRQENMHAEQREKALSPHTHSKMHGPSFTSAEQERQERVVGMSKEASMLNKQTSTTKRRNDDL
jgi:hypothetical protein